MYMYPKLLFISSLILLMSCKTSKNLPPEERVLLSSEIGEVQNEGAPFKIISLEVNEKTVLKVVVEYSTGNVKHEFKCVGSNMISKSLPPIRSVTIVHNDFNDEPKIKVQKTIYFDLKPLLYNGKAIKLNFSNTSQTLLIEP